MARVSRDSRMVLSVLREILGNRRVKVGRMRHEQRMEIDEIARRLKVSRRTVEGDLTALKLTWENIQERLRRERLIRSRRFDDRQEGYRISFAPCLN